MRARTLPLATLWPLLAVDLVKKAAVGGPFVERFP